MLQNNNHKGEKNYPIMARRKAALRLKAFRGTVAFEALGNGVAYNKEGKGDFIHFNCL